jgi:uncharacterized protein (TIGR03067 family)
MSDDLRLLQGSWTVKSLNVEGQKMPEEMLADSRIAIKENRFTSTGMGAEYRGTLELNPSARPPQIDMKFDAGPEKGNTNLGIYKLAGDSWKLCLSTRGHVRPSRFAATAGSGFALETLVRGDSKKVTAKPVALKKTARGKLAPATGEFEGEWTMVSGIFSGKPMEGSLLQWVKRVTHGNQTTVTAGPQVMLNVEFLSDASKSPKTIDYLNKAGSHKGKRQAGIYLLDGGVLTVCISAPGKPRPTKFQSAPGDGRSLTVWKRV